MNKTDELRTARIDSLVTPAELAQRHPVSAAVAEHVTASRRRIEKILNGEDKRLLVVIGPCSIHDLDAAMDYAKRLQGLRDKHQQRLEIVMRTYFEKPRTVVGWKGLISDPDLNGSYRVNHGIELARKLLLQVNELGVPTATEFLDMVTGQFIADLISWGAIGARTTESQLHRQLGIHPVAGAGEGVGEIHLSVGVGAGDDLIPDGNAAVAGEGALLHAGQLLQRRSGGDHLEHGAGGVQTGQEPVQIHTLIVAVVVADLRRVGGVEGGVGDHAEDIAGLIVIHGGHALAARLLPGSDPVHKVTIIPRGRALGVTMQLPEEDRHGYSRTFLRNNLVVLLGGRVAEEIIFDDITTGASNDIERVTRMARKMVCEWGMSEAVGTLAIGETGEEVFIGREWVQNKNFSEDTARLVDSEVKRIVEEAHSRCRKLLEDNLDALHRIAQALLDRETITGDDLDLLMDNKELPPLDTNGKPVPASAAAKGGKTAKSSAEFVIEPDTDAQAQDQKPEQQSEQAEPKQSDAENTRNNSKENDR